MTSKKLKQQRTRLAISQVRLARATGVSRYRIHEFECGYIDLTKDEILKIAKTLENRRRYLASGALRS